MPERDHWSVQFICNPCANHDCRQCQGLLCDHECDPPKPVRPDDRDHSTSIRAASAGLPTLGKKR